MKAWKHQLETDIERMVVVGSSIFTDYEKILLRLSNDGRKWVVSEIEVNEGEMVKDMFYEGMATVLVNKRAKTRFTI
jgi:hypothetical protein